MKIKKVFSFLNRLVNIKESKSTHLYNYDLDNKFPQTLIKILDESPTGTSCVERRAEYIYAKGFIDEQAGSLKVNPFQTANDLLNEIKYQASTFECVAVHVSRRADGTVGMIKSVPFETLRKNSNGDIIYNPTFGESKYNKELDVRYSKFLGSKITTDTLNFLMSEYPDGEIIYHFRKKPAKHIYPIPSFYSAVESIMADAEFGKYKLESVNNSFLPSGILTLVGDIDDSNKDDSGNTEWDYIESQLEAFTGNLKDQSGNTGRQKLMVLHAKTKEEIPTYTTLNNADILNSANESRKDTASTICSAMGVPPFLIGLDGTVGFASNIIADNIELFNNAINDLKNLCEDIFKMCFPQYDWSISNLAPIKYIPDAILNDLTADERRALIGYPAKKIETSVTPVVTNFRHFDYYASIESECLLDIENAVPTDEEMAQRYDDYYKTVNMTYSELQRWSETDCSRKASVNRAPINRNLELLNINKPDWTPKHFRWAGQTIAFVNRMKDGEQGEVIEECGISKRDISLKNWAYDPKK